MQVTDLGNVTGPVLAFGGPYSNVQATRAVLALAKRHGALPLCTGDAVAYCGAPEATVAALRAADVSMIAGNCERQLAAGAPDCGCGFDAGSVCDVMSAGWYGFAAHHVGQKTRLWMGTLPDFITFTHHGLRWGVLHGGATDIARFLWPTTDAAEYEAERDALAAWTGPLDRVVAGHAGIPFERSTARGQWINAGVIGMPPHDGHPQTRYALIQSGAVTLHRLDYDVAGAVADMRAAGLTQGYERGLESGYWPSEDVLPPDLRVSLANG
ncbi:metallophosphoesterase family protein [uncultured Tateyamaria sp.]|uniref:metallophosphoesterase family protein n=1 Tax=Tateyamaria sp. 1078 TaxID=3417464 RepID=UPI002602302D|nr:metallophosphoesterase family protein [uncultured Tateyamaria sp.]